MHCQELLADRPANREGSDRDDAREDDHSHLSELSSGFSYAAHWHGSEILFTILPRAPIGHAKWPANHIPLLAKSLSEQNRHLPLNILHRQPEGEDDHMDGIQLD